MKYLLNPLVESGSGITILELLTFYRSPALHLGVPAGTVTELAAIGTAPNSFGG